MEPPPFGDGNDIALAMDIWRQDLQWSHRPSAMETADFQSARDADADLQWSHRPSAMETCGTPPPLINRILRLQWSHRPSAMETSPWSLIWRCTSSLQWSHPPVIPAKAGIHAPPNHHPTTASHPAPPVIPAKAGNHAHPAPRDSTSIPRRRSTTETIEASKRGGDVDPDFHRGDGVGP